MTNSEALLQIIEEEAAAPSVATPIRLLRADVRTMIQGLSNEEVRSLCDFYYNAQERRIAAAGQVRALSASEEPHGLIAWLASMDAYSEKVIKLAMDEWTMRQPLSRWSRSIPGIGPVLAAGLLAHIDVRENRTVSALWTRAGQNPTSKWEKGEKRPWNARLKVHAWRIGESFVKVSGRDNDIYGKIYLARKELEIERNERGLFAEQAAAGAARVRSTTEAHKYYSQGKLPPGHIHARAKRYAVKLFLGHYWQVAYVLEHGVEPEPAYILAAQPELHTHRVPVPNWPMQ